MDKNKDISVAGLIAEYFALCALLSILVLFKPAQQILDVNALYSKAVVYVTGGLLGMAGVPCTYQGVFLKLPGITLEVKFGCNGLEAVMIYLAAVVVFPAPWKTKLKGAAAGFAAIQIINLARIVLLAWIGATHREFFDTAHLYVAQFMMIALALGMLMLYLNYVTGRVTGTDDLKNETEGGGS
jgi:exosortase/archaeosortase family protein